MWVLTTKAHFDVIIHRLTTIYFQVLEIKNLFQFVLPPLSPSHTPCLITLPLVLSIGQRRPRQLLEIIWFSL